MSKNERATAGKVAAKLKEIGSRPAGKLAEGASILTYVRAVDAHLGVRSHLDCASTDANIPLSLEIPAISIGAGGQGGKAHTPHEWFLPEGRDLALTTDFRRVLGEAVYTHLHNRNLDTVFPNFQNDRAKFTGYLG